MKILAIETSCDETAAAVVENGTKVIGSSVASSTEVHRRYGGVVPELAAREQLRAMIPVLEEALEPMSQKLEYRNEKSALTRPIVSTSIFRLLSSQIDAIAVTVGPGLIGSLLVGVETAKALAFATGKPLIPVNHVLAHMYANFLSPNKENSSRALARDNVGNQKERGENKAMKQFNNETIHFPAISLVASGGHTELYLMESEKQLRWLGGTIDDAAGECFDKAARILGFGTGGGASIQEAAKKRHGTEVRRDTRLPRPLLHDETLNFSFSGLKTALMRLTEKLKTNQQCNNTTIEQLAHELQEAVTDVLVAKTTAAASRYHARTILLSGGVAANTRLREKFAAADSHNRVLAPPVSLCTDNAVSIAACAYFRGEPVPWQTVDAVPDLDVELHGSQTSE